jgi:hypothetical protein
VKTVKELGATRLVRFCTLRGADRDIKDNADLKPIDLVELENFESEKLKNDTLMILGPSGATDFLMRSPPTRLMYKSYKLPIVVISYLLISFCIQGITVFPRLPWEITLVNGILLGFLFLFKFLVMCTDPGYIKNQVNMGDLLKVVDSLSLCAECETIRTSRSRHCAICH